MKILSNLVNRFLFKVTHPEINTSAAAYESIREKADSQSKTIMEYMIHTKYAIENGATTKEISRATGIDYENVKKRCCDLRFGTKETPQKMRLRRKYGTLIRYGQPREGCHPLVATSSGRYMY